MVDADDFRTAYKNEEERLQNKLDQALGLAGRMTHKVLFQHLPILQDKFIKCGLRCCDQDSTHTVFQNCISECSSQLNRINDLVESDFAQFNDLTYRCHQECSSAAKTNLKDGLLASKNLVDCFNQCIDESVIKKIPKIVEGLDFKFKCLDGYSA